MASVAAKGPVAEGKKGTAPFCRNGPKGASHKRGLSPFFPLAALLLAAALVGPAAHGAAGRRSLEEMDVDRWGKLREVERYQLQIAEKYCREQNWKVAAAEYEKYVTLYQRSEGGPYAQLKWALCQVRLRQGNTAIKDGFQSVIDYWPDSPDAIVAAYFIGDTYRKIGQADKAKKAFLGLIESHPRHPASIRAMADLIEIAADQQDRPAQAALWKKLTYEVQRTKETAAICVQASHELAAYSFSVIAFDDGMKALATSHPERDLPEKVGEYLREPLARLAESPDTRSKADKLLEAAVAYLRGKAPADVSQPADKAAARQIWLSIADLRAAARATDKVIETYDQVFKRFGADDQVLGRLAAWYESINRFDDARTTYRRFSDKVAGLSRVAQSYFRQRQYDQAIATYRELMGLDPGNKPRWKGEIAATLAHARKYNEAIDAYAELIKEDPGQADAWRWRMALAYKDARRYHDAIAQLRQCNNFPANYREMALCHRALRQYNEALMLYQQIIGGDPKSAPGAMFQIGMTFEEAGQKERAIKALQQVCKQYPRDGHASQAHAHLQRQYKISVTLGGDLER